MSGYVSIKDQKILCLRSGNRCVLPACRNELIVNENNENCSVIIGEMAHIKGEKPTAARYDPNMTDEERNNYNNLILVCRNCHTTIDAQFNAYPTEILLEIKRNHETWIRESTKTEIINITFAELSIVTKFLVSGQYRQSNSFAVIPPQDKLNKNNLSDEITALIIMGLTQVKQVTHFIDECPDIEFGECLRQGFVDEYNRLRNDEQLLGDELFLVLLDFASGKSNDFKQKAAGLSVLVYLFENCDVFEK